MTSEERVAAGSAALRGGRWAEARAAFEAALAERETAEPLEGLADALWWQCQAVESVRCRERAYVLHRRTGDAARACRAAIDLCIAYAVNLGNGAASGGWLARAEAAVRDLDPNPLQGWLWLMRGFLTSDRARARELFERALEFGRAAGDADLELVALTDLGLALVTAGRADEGLALLDEAMAATLAGEHTRLDTVVFATCNMLAACSKAGDLERAADWCRAAADFMRTYSSPFLFAQCRVHYGHLLLEKGHWARAESELRAALDMAADVGHGPRAEALARLAELRFRQGRIEEAETLLADVDEHAAPALPLAAIRLARGESAAAAALLERQLDRAGDEAHIEDTPALALLVDAYLAGGRLDAAAETVERLDAVARAQDRAHPAALATCAAARVANARGADDDAARLFERALERLSPLDLPLETARVRIELAHVLARTRPALAVPEARAALTTFERLGAAADADATASLLRSLGATGRTTGPRDAGVLTRREREVLRLVGLGLSNPEIADRLFISRKTASHHVSRVLAKLGLRNRAEAAAFAVRTEIEA